MSPLWLNIGRVLLTRVYTLNIYVNLQQNTDIRKYNLFRLL